MIENMEMLDVYNLNHYLLEIKWAMMKPKQKVLRCRPNEFCDAIVRHENKESVEVISSPIPGFYLLDYDILEADRPFDFVNLDFNT